MAMQYTMELHLRLWQSSILVFRQYGDGQKSIGLKKWSGDHGLWGTCAFSATDMPVAVEWQLQGDTVKSGYKLAVSWLFIKAIGNRPLSLSNMLFASDRGYWNKILLHNFILSARASVQGMVKRYEWSPFTCSPQYEDNTSKNPQFTNSNGYKRVY
jgi:hypothetical protein